MDGAHASQNFPRIRVSIFDASGLISNAKIIRELMEEVCDDLMKWMEKQPDSHGALNGLIVFDEAERFAPASDKGIVRTHLMDLGDVAAKKGFGFLFATESPMDMDDEMIDRCSCVFFGRANSPGAIDAMKSRCAPHGLAPADIPRLSQGRFFFVSPEIKSYFDVE